MNKIFLKNLFEKLSRILTPRVPIGGIELTNTDIVFVGFDMGSQPVIQLAQKTAAPLFENHQDDYAQLTTTLSDALGRLRAQIPYKPNRRMPVALSIPDTLIYTQVFSLPILQGDDFENAVKLNLQTISPIDFESAYCDWKQLGDASLEATSVQVLASFVDKNLINALERALSLSGFYAIAIEQKAASIIRALAGSVEHFDKTKSHCLVHITSDGISLSLIKGSTFCFNRSLGWPSVVISSSNAREIAFKDFKEIVVSELRSVLNFYSNRFQDTISTIYIIAPGIADEVKNIIAGDFSTPVLPVVLQGERTVSQEWVVPFGAAARGLLARSIDTDISLTPQNTETHYFQSQVISFLSLWRTIIAVVSVVLLAVFLGTYWFLNSFHQSIALSQLTAKPNAQMEELNLLRQEAAAFNQNVAAGLDVALARVLWPGILSDIYSIAGSDAIVTHVSIQAEAKVVTIEAKGANEQVAVDFKNKLLSLPYIQSADVPLDGIVQDGSMVSFRVVAATKSRTY